MNFGRLTLDDCVVDAYQTAVQMAHATIVASNESAFAADIDTKIEISNTAPDGANSSECLPEDRVFGTRAVDGDGDGTPECDVGSIEVPEPGFLVGFWLGLAGLWHLAAIRTRRDRAVEA